VATRLKSRMVTRPRTWPWHSHRAAHVPEAAQQIPVPLAQEQATRGIYLREGSKPLGRRGKFSAEDAER